MPCNIYLIELYFIFVNLQLDKLYVKECIRWWLQLSLFTVPEGEHRITSEAFFLKYRIISHHYFYPHLDVNTVQPKKLVFDFQAVAKFMAMVSPNLEESKRSLYPTIFNDRWLDNLSVCFKLTHLFVHDLSLLQIYTHEFFSTPTSPFGLVHSAIVGVIDAVSIISFVISLDIDQIPQLVQFLWGDKFYKNMNSTAKATGQTSSSLVYPITKSPEGALCLIYYMEHYHHLPTKPNSAFQASDIPNQCQLSTIHNHITASTEEFITKVSEIHLLFCNSMILTSIYRCISIF